MTRGSNFGVFQRPVGARADLRELLYISALLQTDKDLREDATVTATDIRLYLRSRYGLDVPYGHVSDIVCGLGGTHGKKNLKKEDGDEDDVGEETAQDLGSEHSIDNAMRGTRVLGGDHPDTDEDSHDLESGSAKHNIQQSADTLKRLLHIAQKGNTTKEESLDIVQLTSSLLIPTLLRASTEAQEPGPDDTMESHDDMEAAGTNSIESEQQQCAEETSEKHPSHPPPQQIIRDVLRLMLSKMDGVHALRRGVASRHVAGKGRTGEDRISKPRRVILSEHLVRTLLETFLELEAAKDDALVRDMVAAAGGDGVPLDELAFARALTSDVSAWKVGVEDELSETFVDVYGFDPVDANEYSLGAVVLDVATGVAQEAAKTHNKLAPSQDGPKYAPTAPYIDYVADSNRGLLFVVLLWVFYLFCIAIFYMVLGGNNFEAFQCGQTFGCHIAHQLFRWMLLGVVLSAGGMIVITPVSLGNDPYQRNWKIVFFSVFCQLLYCVVPYVAIRRYEADIPHSADGELSRVEKNMSGYYFVGATNAFLILGCLLAVRLLMFMATLSTPIETAMKWSHFLQRVFIPINTRMSAAIKHAATHKLNNMLGNAMKLHCQKVHGKDNANAEENFILSGYSYENCGGLIWTWQNIWSNDIMTVEGVWLHSRLFVGQIGQLISIIFLVALWIIGTERLASSAEEHRDNIKSDRLSHSRQWALWMTPEGWMIEVSFFVGGFLALSSAVALILIYLPSTVSTVLKLRSGVIPSFEDTKFPQYRSGADKIFYNVGNMVYALIGSSILFFGIFAGIIFLFVWPPSKETMMMFLAWCIGLGLTIGLKMVLMGLARAKFHTALFRTRPRAANFNSLAMECWNIGLGGGTLISRITQFFFAACFWIGRVDVTFLDEDIKMLGYQFDYTPKHYRKEILVHEAHRHPYIDRLGGMFMMRLKHGTGFCSDAGATWRILFVLALFPWLLKYRCGYKHRQGRDEDDMVTSLISLSASLADRKGNDAAANLLEKVAERVRMSHAKDGLSEPDEDHAAEHSVLEYTKGY